MPSQVTPGVLTAAVGALLTFLAAFLTWATVEVTSRAGGLLGGGTRSTSGLQGDRLGKATLVLALAAVALCVLLLQPSSRAWGWIALTAVGGLIVVLALVDLAAISDASDLRQRLGRVAGCSAAVQCSGSRTAGIGVYLTVVGGLVIVVGALLHHGVLAGLQTRLRNRSQARSEARAAVPAGAGDASTAPSAPDQTIPEDAAAVTGPTAADSPASTEPTEAAGPAGAAESTESAGAAGPPEATGTEETTRQDASAPASRTSPPASGAVVGGSTEEGSPET